MDLKIAWRSMRSRLYNIIPIILVWIPGDPGDPVDPGGFDVLSFWGRKVWGWGVYGVLGLCFTSLSCCAFSLFSYSPVFALGHTSYKYLYVSRNFPSVEEILLDNGRSYVYILLLVKIFM